MRPLLDKSKNPSCLRCNSPMRLTRVEDEYPGYQRRMFECASRLQPLRLFLLAAVFAGVYAASFAITDNLCGMRGSEERWSL